MKLVVVVSSGERLEMHSGVWQRVLLENTEFLSQSSVDIVVPHISSDSGISADAQPGYSEHQLGLAVDVFDASNEKEFTSNSNYRKYVKWLQNNAHIYGWTQSYQK
jgi:hypothetical protein